MYQTHTCVCVFVLVCEHEHERETTKDCVRHMCDVSVCERVSMRAPARARDSERMCETHECVCVCETVCEREREQETAVEHWSARARTPTRGKEVEETGIFF